MLLCIFFARKAKTNWKQIQFSDLDFTHVSDLTVPICPFNGFAETLLEVFTPSSCPIQRNSNKPSSTCWTLPQSHLSSHFSLSKLWWWWPYVSKNAFRQGEMDPKAFHRSCSPYSSGRPRKEFWIILPHSSNLRMCQNTKLHSIYTIYRSPNSLDPCSPEHSTW